MMVIAQHNAFGILSAINPTHNTVFFFLPKYLLLKTLNSLTIRASYGLSFAGLKCKLYPDVIIVML